MAVYSEKVMEHFMNPKNVGVIEDADGIGEVGNPICGDMMTFYIKVKDGRLEDIKYQTFGCGAAIAVSSMISELAKGKKIEEAIQITNKVVAEALGGLPSNKLHCSNLGAEALRKAIEDYQLKKAGKKVPQKEVKKEREEERAAAEAEEERCLCPYCDSALTEIIPYCKSCGRSLKICPECGETASLDSRFCPHCGTKLEGEK